MTLIDVTGLSTLTVSRLLQVSSENPKFVNLYCWTSSHCLTLDNIALIVAASLGHIYSICVSVHARALVSEQGRRFVCHCSRTDYLCSILYSQSEPQQTQLIQSQPTVSITQVYDHYLCVHTHTDTHGISAQYSLGLNTSKQAVKNRTFA